MQSKRIFRVVEIVDETQLIIDCGLFDGAKKNDTVEIYKKGRNVRNPINGADLGTWDIIKATLTVTEVFDRFSICKDKRNALSSILESENIEDTLFVYQNLNIDPNSATNNTNPSDYQIEVGDFVRIIDLE